MEAEGVRAEVFRVEPHELGTALERLVERGVPRVAVAGGDGSLRTAAGVLAGSGTALAPIPAGTLNHFARRYGIDSLDAAARALAHGRLERVPVGVANGQVFLNTATIGLYADVVRRRERLRRWLGKWPAAALALALRLARPHWVEVTIEAEGERHPRRTPLVWAGVGRRSFPFVHEADEPRRRPDLEIIIPRPSNRVEILGILLRLFFRIVRGERPAEDPALEVVHARRVVIHAAHPIGVTLDGETFRWHSPLHLGVQDDALWLVLRAEGES
jgi:diacylglycerol kinase family enzyme